MHTYTAQVVRANPDGDDYIEEWYIHYNSDFSGNIKITPPFPWKSEPGYYEVPGEVLVQFLGDIARSAFTSWAEDLDLKEFLERYR